MKSYHLNSILFYAWLAVFAMAGMPVQAEIEGSLDPASVVEKWSNSSTYPKVIDINFSDEMWPGHLWTGETGKDCPEWADSAYVNAILRVPANGGSEVTYPVLFHNCTFANKTSYKGYAGATSAFCRQYYLGENKTGNSATTYNDWTVPGHTNYLEDNIKYDADNTPIYGEAGFVQFCRNEGYIDVAAKRRVSLHGWMEIDHIPYVERIQWSWSSTSWGRGIKCDIKIGDEDWKPLVWMGSNKHKAGYTVFSDQGYFMENVIDAHDVSIRWRVWDGDNGLTLVQTKPDGTSAFGVAVDTVAQQQTARVHKIQIFGTAITAEQAQYATDHPVGNVGTLSDLNAGGGEKVDDAPDANAPVVLLTVAQDGTGDYTKVQQAINAVPDGSRGIIYIRPGVYEENIYCGTKTSHDKYISLVGENKETTILTSSVDRGSNNPSNTYNDCAALNVYTTRFYAENLTIRNTAGNVGQAEALFTSGDAHLFNNCVLSGYQDTYKANIGSRGYFTGCTIIGATDFIYDSGLEWFENCEIRCVKGGGYITAAADCGLTLTRTLHPELSVSPFYAGLFFRGCNVVADEGVADGAYYLGRPWKEKCGTMFLQCTLGSHINAKGWKEWSGTEAKCCYMEYKNVDASGNPVDVSSRVSFGHQATDAEVQAYMNPEFLFDKFSSVPFDYEYILEGAAAPTGFEANGNAFTWQSDSKAAGYIIYKDGQFVALVSEPSFATDGSDAAYTVSAVSRHGVVGKAVKMEEKGELIAFPTAQGFGKYATGGRGGKVVTVTSLDDVAGQKGTLRWAFTQYPDEPITIVFAVSGEIQLKDPLSVKRADWTLAGQTAPGEGIVLSRNKVNFGGSQNFIVRNIRFRSGATNTAGEVLADQACGVENCNNFIFDHCVFGWSVEENMNTQDSHFLTVQYSMVHEGLYNSGHPKGARGYGSQWGGSPATYHHNLLAHNKSRSPRINGARGDDYVVFMEYANNVNYNFSARGTYGGENTADIVKYNGVNSVHECNFMNNYYKPGKIATASSSKFLVSSYARAGATSWAPAKWYVNGNVMEGNTTATNDNWKAVGVETYTLDDIRVDERIVTATPYNKYSIDGGRGVYVPERYMLQDIATAQDAYTDVVNHAGTINRDKVEQRIANEVLTGTCTYGGAAIGAGKGIIDTENDAEGFYAYSTDYTVPADTDGDGMPDEWENKHGLNPQVADQNLVNLDGYTALEVYLNELMGEKMDSDFTTAITSVMKTPSQMLYDAGSATLHVGEETVGSRLSVYTADGRLVKSLQITDRQTHLGDMPQGLLLMQVEGRSICPRTIKVVQ